MRSFYSFQYDKASCGVSVGVYEHKNPKHPDLRKNGILILLSITRRQILPFSDWHHDNLGPLLTQQYTKKPMNSKIGSKQELPFFMGTPGKNPGSSV